MGIDELERDPYPAFAELRRRAPVLEGEVMALLGTDLPMTSGLNAVEGPSFSVLGYAEARDVLRDGATFSSSAYAGAIGQVLGHTILEMDEPEHRRSRRLISAAFASRTVERWRDSVVRPIIRELIDGFRDQGTADLVEVLTFVYPVQVIARLLGLPREDVEQFHQWATLIVDPATFADPDLAAARDVAMTSLTEYLQGIMADRRRSPRDDVITMLVTAEIEGESLDDEEVMAFLRLLLPAGAETTFRSSGNLLFALLSDPEQLALVRADLGRIPSAIEEALRWEPPIMTIGRVTTRAVRVGPCEIPEGAAVHVSLASANHDDTVFDEPDRYDMQREAKPHLSFAAGPHTCIGLHLARLEMTVALEEIFAGLPELRFADAQSPGCHVSGLGFREPTALPVIWNPDAR